MRPLDTQARLVRIRGEVRRGLSVVEHYMRRPSDLKDIPYL
ncbi:hypothetical protein TUN199_11540 [Pyrenophora tritici-repentis]|uniref:Uncharacterized protein n=1 Tax=Pyrenophora tritici-repentis TaxID=45151 RepID=A0A922SZT2_9PLEO|nr:hypothetical protein TUN199_11540 [Pyrenophora tritici-repentis]KAI1515605.1 hypothetical protein Ptr86124_005606 [Pyrenophora tritici-repentis]KAI1678593.1 hypothetical protein KJE20_12201 [Pyrenophora tritici-repentis]